MVIIDIMVQLSQSFWTWGKKSYGDDSLTLFG